MSKKPFVAKLSIPNERDELTSLEVEGGRFNFFKKLFGKSSKMAKINLLVILFALPAIAWFFYSFMLRKAYDNNINYSGNLGLGYSMVENAVERGNFALFYGALQHYIILIPLIILAFIGLGGGFYSMRRFAQGEERITKNFFKGIKKTFADFFMHGLLAGITILIFAVNWTIYDAYGIHLAWKVIGIICAILFVLIVLIYLMYACTISTSYKTGFKTIIKDSILFGVNLPIQSIFMSLIGALPIVVLYFALPGMFLNEGDFFSILLTTIGVALVFFLGFSLIISSWITYTDYVYELGFSTAKTIKNVEQKNQGKNNSSKKRA